MIIKLLGPFIGLLISIMNIIIRKPKGKSFSNRQWILIIVLIISSIIAVIVIVDDSNDEKLKINQLQRIVTKSDQTIQSLKKLNVSDSITITLLNKQIVDSKKSEEQAQKERIELKKLLEPFEKIAAEKYPDFKLKNALDKIIQDLDNLSNKTEYLEHRENFIPLSNKRKELLKKSFEHFDPIFKENFDIEVICGIDNVNRKKFAEELRDLLKFVGFEKVEIRWGYNLVIGRYSSPIVFYCNENDISSITEFLTILAQYMFELKTKPIFQPKYKNNDKNFISFDIKADPYFNKEGVISFE